MALNFCANLSFMFQDTPTLLSRYARAKAAGFKAVECAFPYDLDINELVQTKEEASLEQVLINAPPGDWNKGERGLACLPGRQADFIKSIETAIKYAKGLKCKRVHVMAGIGESSSEELLKLYVDNLRLAARRFEENNLLGVIEPINQYSLPGYFLNNYDTALKALEAVNSENLKMQLDIFHLQQINGNLSRSIQSLLPFVGHIQIAQVPDRHEPDTPGEINYSFIFELLKTLKYDGWIGLEYTPKAKTEEGLTWIQNMGCSQ